MKSSRSPNLFPFANRPSENSGVNLAPSLTKLGNFSILISRANLLSALERLPGLLCLALEVCLAVCETPPPVTLPRLEKLEITIRHPMLSFLMASRLCISVRLSPIGDRAVSYFSNSPWNVEADLPLASPGWFLSYDVSPYQILTASPSQWDFTLMQ